MACPSTYTIPFRYPHGGIVIGKGGSNVKQLALRTNTIITTHKADPSRNMPLPYFKVQIHHSIGVGFTGVLRAVMEIQGLLLTSMMNAEHKYSKSTHKPSPPTTPPPHSTRASGPSDAELARPSAPPRNHPQSINDGLRMAYVPHSPTPNTGDGY